MKTHLALAFAFTTALSAPTHAALIGHWAFDDGVGSEAVDSSGAGNTGSIVGATWASDATRASYLSFNGTDASVDPSFNLPVMTATNDFTWAFWANAGAGTINEVILGNRYSGANTVDFAPRQFIKFTPTQFEWHQNGNGNDNLDYADLAVGEWHHNAVVKTGLNLDYYLDGSLVQSSTLGEAIGTEALPLFIGGNPGAAAGEHFTGSIDDVRIYDHALSAADVLALAIPEPSALLLAAAGSLLLFRRRR